MKCDSVLSGSCASTFYLSFLGSEPIDFYVCEYIYIYIYIYIHTHTHINVYIYKQGKAAPLQAWSGPEGSRKLMFPVYMTTAQDGGSLSALRTGRLYPYEMPLVLISVRG